MPVAFTSTSTSNAFGPCSSTTSIVSGSPAFHATAALVFMRAPFQCDMTGTLPRKASKPHDTTWTRNPPPRAAPQGRPPPRRYDGTRPSPDHADGSVLRGFPGNGDPRTQHQVGEGVEGPLDGSALFQVLDGDDARIGFHVRLQRRLQPARESGVVDEH